MNDSGLIINDLSIVGAPVKIRLPLLKCAQGSWVRVTATSGFGKTTLMRAIAGFIPSTGEIRLSGLRIDALPIQKREIGIVFQEQHLFSHLTVGENVAYGLTVRGESKSETKDEVLDALDSVGLASKFNAPVTECSGGERQRIAILRSLIWQPKLAIFDEPLTGLDESSRKLTLNWITSKLEETGAPMIWISHSTDDFDLKFDQQLVGREGAQHERTFIAEPYSVHH